MIQKERKKRKKKKEEVQELACSCSYGVNKTILTGAREKAILLSPSGMEPTAHLA